MICFSIEIHFNFSYRLIFNYYKLRERFDILISLERPSIKFVAPCSSQLISLFEAN